MFMIPINNAFPAPSFDLDLNRTSSPLVTIPSPSVASFPTKP